VITVTVAIMIMIVIAIVIATTIRSTRYTAQLAIIVADVAAALVDMVKSGVTPASASRLAARSQIIAPDLDVAARLQVRTARRSGVIAIVITTSSAWKHPALTLQTAIHVGDIGTAPLVVVEPCAAPISIALLAFGDQIISPNLNVPARLPV